jgi:hypothetical protein
MRRLRFRRPSHATVIAYAALFVALSGTAVAATGGNFILGKSNSASTATQLSSGAGNALKVTDTNGGTGVYASGGNHSKNTAAVHGQSGAGNAVEGFSTANPASGVYGQDNNANSYGVAGHSDNGVAVVGDSSNGWAMQALGNATQNRKGSGFVKAMALVEPQFNDPIQQCFNSQLSPNQATSGDCGITYQGPGGGAVNLLFGFKVDDRIVSVTSNDIGVSASAYPITSTTDQQLHVRTTHVSGTAADSGFYIVVY